MRTLKKFCCLRFSKIISSLCNDNLSFELCQGSTSVSKKVTKLTTAEVCLPFRNIARDRDRGATHLIGQAINLSLGKSLGRVVERGHQIHRLLPHDQVFVGAGPFLQLIATACKPSTRSSDFDFFVPTRDSSPSHCLYWVLGTGYSSPRVSNVHYIAILHNVILAFQPQRAFGAGVGL